MRLSKGLNVKVYTKGGWDISGEIESETVDKLVLIQNNRFIIYKDSISIIEFLEEPVVKQKKIHIASKVEPQREASNDFPENPLSYGEYQFGLPKSMLINNPEEDDSDDDLSITFKNESSSINFEVKDDK